jgi:cAMP-dependent protein kinase regulator
MSDEAMKQALAAHQRSPLDFGLVVRAIRLLEEGSYRAEAHSVAHTYAQRHDTKGPGGDALLSAVQRATVRSFRAGESLVREGLDDDSMFVLLSGDARVRRLGVGELAQLAPGAVIGEIAPLTGTARTASVYARGEARALEFPAAALAELSRRLPGVYARLRETGRARMVEQLMGPESIFGPLGDMERAALFEQCLPCTVAEGTTIITEGQPGTAVCIIASGMAEVWRGLPPHGERRVLAGLKPGDIFGELSLLTDRIASASVEATTTLTLFCLTPPRFEQALERHEDARNRVLDLARQRLRPAVRGSSTPPAASVARDDFF